MPLSTRLAAARGQILLLLAALSLALAACAPAASPGQPTAAGDGSLRVVATTTIVGDVVRNVGGDAIDLTVLLPVGADPHGFEPAPADIAAVSAADAVFVNGLDLEQFLTTLLENAGGHARTVAVSDGIVPLSSAGDPEDAAAHDEEAEHAGGGDPHTWTDPNNVLVWVDNIQRALAELDPANAPTYSANAARYKAELQTLDGWISQQVGQIPPSERRLVTDHAVFGYFARRYGFEQTGAVAPGYSTLAESSAQELARLEDRLRGEGVKAIFVGSTASSALSQRVADDTGIQLVRVYSGSLSAPGGPAATYLDYMRYNVAAMVKALQ